MLGEGLPLDALPDHGPEDTEHGGAALVELHVELELELLTLEGPAEVAGAVVTGVVGGGPGDELHEAGTEEDLGEPESGNLKEPREAVRDVCELHRTVEGQGPRDLDPSVVDEHADDGDHRDAAVLALDGAAAFEGLRLSLEPAEGVEDAQGVGDANLELVDAEGGGRLGHGGGGERGGGGEEGGKDGDCSLGTRGRGLEEVTRSQGRS